MIINSSSIESLKPQDYQDLSTKILNRDFGRENDNIELSILDSNDSIIIIDNNFKDYTPIKKPTTEYLGSIDIDYVKVLRDYGFNNGKYKLRFSFQRKLIQNNTKKIFSISEISPSRTEIKAQVSSISDMVLSEGIYDIQNQLFSSPYVKDINLNFDNSIYSLILNILLDTTQTPNSILVKLYEPLPTSLSVGSSFRIIEEIINPLEIEVDLGSQIITVEEGLQIAGPNFSIATNLNTSVQSEFRNYDDILQNGSVSSSFNNLVNYLSGSFPINLDFTNTNTPSGYHFENFVHFSSAVERLKNFEYKMRLIESYNGEINALDTVSGGITSSVNFIKDKSQTRAKIDNIIQNFDPYERFLYFESGAYCWPKYDSTKPYSNVSSSSPIIDSWLGVEISGYRKQYNGGQLLSASLFDDQNVHALVNTLPDHIHSNSDNEQFLLFTEMVAHHFDNIWNYIESINDINKADSSLTQGISKSFIFDALQNTGIPAYDQFENTNLFEYLIGGNKDGTFQYSTTDGTTMVTASNAGSIPKGDITKEVWKRLYHNAPYLLKTKGTERSIKAIMACYGIPESILHVKEYGGPNKDKTGYKTFSYPKVTKWHKKKDSALPQYVLLHNNFFEFNKSFQYRFINSYSSGDGEIGLVSFFQNPYTAFHIRVTPLETDDYLESGSLGHLLMRIDNVETTSSLIPIYNDEPWNLSVVYNPDDTDQTFTAYVTQVNHNKNLFMGSCSFSTSQLDIDGFNLDPGYNLYVYTSTGPIQEYRTWSEILTKDTIVSQSFSPLSYNGNSISSSYESLLVRVPLGSDFKSYESSSSSTSDVNYAPNVSYRDTYTVKLNTNLDVSNIEETYHLLTPDTVGSSMSSDKVRIDSGSIDNNWLSPFQSIETSPQDRQPLDYSDLGIFFSPTFEINEDIIHTLGGFRLDDYIGDPTYYTSSYYPSLKTLNQVYNKKLERRYNFYDYIRTIQFFDHTLFKVIKSFTPAKANLKTGLVIEPHYLERAKIPGKNITKEHISENALQYVLTGSIDSINEPEYFINIDIIDYVESGSYGTATENVAQINLLSNKYDII